MAGRKTPRNYQFGVVSTDGGKAANPSPSEFGGGTGQGRAPLLDNHGRLIVRIAGPAGYAPLPDCANPIYLQTASFSLVIQSQIIAGIGILQQFFGYNAAASLRWAQLHDVNAALVSGTSVPQITVPVPPNSAFSVAVPWGFNTGVRAAISTTGPEWTDPGVAELWWNFIGAKCTL